MRVLSLDIGEKRIGIAVSDTLRLTAQPLETLRRKTIDSDLGHIKAIVENMDVSEIVVGLPLNMNGSEGPRAKEIYGFVEDLKKELEIPVKFWDERLTTAQANRVLIEADVRRKKRKRLDDRLAAQLILQSYLDSTKRGQV